MQEAPQHAAGRLHARRIEHGAAIGPRLQGDQALDLENLEGFAQRALGAAVLGHQRLLVGQPVAFAQPIAHDAAPQIITDQLGQLLPLGQVGAGGVGTGAGA